jgi:peptide/nickel transport system substrate-binding protein
VVGRATKSISVRSRLTVLLAVIALAITACGGRGPASAGDQPAASGKVGDTLTVVSVIPPQTLDPAKTAQNNAWLAELAYQPLIVRRSDGTLTPGLAESWSYTGTGNRTFELRLRSGVTFADGSELTAENVVDHLRYVVKSGGQMAPMLANNTFTATDPHTVTITAGAPNPNFPEILSQDYVVGGVISKAGLARPDELGTRTFGAGPYQLDPDQTVAGDHYTFVANPHFYDKPSVHWRKVVVRIITNAQSVLNALKTGQADVAVGDPATASAAEQAGLTVVSTPFLWSGVVLADRAGTQAKPLADVRVRQALNLATDRQAIADALFPGLGEPTNQLTVPGGYGYDAALNKTYPHDEAGARRLLTEAGYANGFTLRLVTPRYQQLNLLAQALADQWRKVGVTLDLTDHANPNEFTSDAFGGKFPAFMTSFGQIPIWMEGPSLFLPTAAFNPFHVADAELAGLFDRAARASGQEKDRLDREIQAHLVREAWFVPVVTTGLPYYARKTVTGLATSPKAPVLSLYEVRQAA